MKENTQVVHVNSWKEFKKLAIGLHPDFIAYAEEQVPLSRPPIGLRLLFATESTQYVFLDLARGNTFWRTKLPVHTHESGSPYLKKEDLKNFIHAELNRKDISIISFGVL